MSIGSFLLSLALATLVMPFVIGPFIKDNRRKRQTSPEYDGSAPARAQQDALVALRDLDFDFRTGKIVDEDYALLRQRLVAEAAQALQAANAPQPDLDAEIEAAVRVVRATHVAKARSCPHCRAPLAASSKFCPQCGAALEAECPGCHEAIRPDDNFCARCGAPLKLEAAPVL